MTGSRSRWLVLLLCAAASLGLAAQPELPEVEALVVLTGSLRAAEAERFVVPVTSNWQATLKWLIPEGQRVQAGDSVALLDPGGTEDRLYETEHELITKVYERDSEEATRRLTRMDLELALKRADTEYRKAKLDAAVPQDVLKGADFRQRQLDMKKKQKAFEAAQLELLNHDASTAATLAGLDIEIKELETDYERYEKELDSLDLRATRAGIVIHEEHRWMGRKVLEGDRLRPTFPIARIPDMDTLEVEAWAGEAEASRLEVGQDVTMHLDAFPQRAFLGEVLSVAATGERRLSWGRASYFKVRISLETQDPEIMKPGMSVRCEIDVVGLPALAESS